MKFLSETFVVRFDESTKSLLILHPDKVEFPDPLVTIRQETYASMEFNEAAEFLGARLLLLIPSMREQFKEHLDRLASSEDGRS